MLSESTFYENTEQELNIDEKNYFQGVVVSAGSSSDIVQMGATYIQPTGTELPTILTRINLLNSEIENLNQLTRFNISQQLILHTSPYSTSETKNSVKEEIFKEKFNNLLILALDTIFEDGIENDFSRKIFQFIKYIGIEFIFIINDYLSQKNKNINISYEILKIIGRSEDKQTKGIRRWLLEKNLNQKDYLIKDGAIIGLSYIDDPKSIPIIKNQISHEHNPAIIEDLKDLLEQLLDTQHAQNTKKS